MMIGEISMNSIDRYIELYKIYLYSEEHQEFNDEDKGTMWRDYSNSRHLLPVTSHYSFFSIEEWRNIIKELWPEKEEYFYRLFISSVMSQYDLQTPEKEVTENVIPDYIYNF